MKKVLLLYGGNSSEHRISLLSADFIYKNIDFKEFETTRVLITQTNEWFKKTNEDLIKITNIIEFIKSFDVVFPIIHGRDGEDGKIQSLCELFNIKYVGCKNNSSLICYDKELTKNILSKNNIEVTPYTTIYKNKQFKLNNLSYPVIVKPAREGSSIGITVVKNKKDLHKALDFAFKYDNKLLIEPFLNVLELEVAVLEDKKWIISDIGELKNNNWYSYEEKYELKNTNINFKTSLSKKHQKTIIKYVKDIIALLEIKGYSRIDFFYDTDNDKIYFNEINTIPGFTEISMFPKLLNLKGYSSLRLITTLINSALKK